MTPSPHEITHLLKAWSAGDKSALDRLMPLVYRDLHRLAQKHMSGERDGHTLETTALVHEVCVRLVDSKQVNWKDRAHFFAVSAQIMRHILLDRARRRAASKRGGSAERLSLDELPDLGSGRARELIALDDALNTLAANDARKARVVELRFFGGLSVEETAAVLQVSPETVMRDWKFARSRLQAELSGR